jgi:hypothetical protein
MNSWITSFKIESEYPLDVINKNLTPSLPIVRQASTSDTPLLQERGRGEVLNMMILFYN